MALPVIANLIRVALQGKMPNGAQWVNVFHVVKPGATSYPSAITFLDPVVVKLMTVSYAGGNTWKAEAPTTATWDLARYTPLDGSAESTIISHSVAGVNAGEALPNQNALVISFRTGFRGPANRGRVFTAPYVEGLNNANGTPSSTLTANMQAQWAGFQAELKASSYDLVVASYLHASSRTVTSIVVDSRWDTMRRRLGR